MSRYIRLLTLLLSLAILMTVAPAAARPAAAPAALPAGVQDLRAQESGLHFSLSVPSYQLDEGGLITAAGLASHGATPGAPALPYLSAFIALPPQATARVTVAAADTASHTLSRPLAAAPAAGAELPPVDEALHGAPGPLAGDDTPDPAFYSRDALFPDSVYRLSEPMYFRDLRVVRLDLFPLRYNAARSQLQHSPRLDVTIAFEGARFDELRLAPTPDDRYARTLAGALLNPQQAAGWRSLPAAPDVPAAASSLPIGQESYKIAVAADGIYEISRADLAAAGMNVGSVNPNTFAMMYRGEPVAYQFVGNGNNQFEEGEAIRFYGWAFDGTRDEQQYVAENVFWLWPNGTPDRIEELPEGTATTPATSFRAEVTRAPQWQYSNTRLDEDDWAASPNEPDAWYWEFIDRTGVDPTTVHTVTRTIDVPHPATSDDASLTVELLSYALSGDVTVSMGPGFTHQITKVWTGGVRNDNIVLSLPASALQHGENQVQLTFSNQTVNRLQFFVNRFTVSYPRQFVADDDLLIFQGEAGNHTYQVSGFSLSTTPLVWEISDRLQPRAVDQVTTADDGGSATYTFHSGAAGSAFVATNTQAMKEPAAISRYVAPSLDPPGGADWLAIIDPDFGAPINTLAAHRQKPLFGGLTTAVVSIDDVINQYGHGLPLPNAIRSYLSHALFTWSTAPSYVLLAGDATVNPNHVTCDGPNDQYFICNIWEDNSARNHVPTHLLFKDRFQGHVPTDYPNVLLAGDDLLPDMAIGRFAVESAQEASNIVAKIMDYETAHLTPGPAQNAIVFLSDNPDVGGNFPEESLQVAGLLTPDFKVTLIAQANSSDAAATAARSATRDAIHAPQGATILNYRGHGSRTAWGGNPALFNVTDPSLWPWPAPPAPPWLASEPLVILSLDCLDGNFVYPGEDALSEVFHALQEVGTVAHWSSTGLGYAFEHRKLHQEFYRAAINHDILPIGDVINYTKAEYAATAHHESELWTFTLQGDPAMLLWQPRPDFMFLPMLTR